LHAKGRSYKEFKEFKEYEEFQKRSQELESVLFFLNSSYSLYSFASSHQYDRPVLEADFVDGAGTTELVGTGEDHVDSGFGLGFEPL
jgi:hypothetical protein